MNTEIDVTKLAEAFIQEIRSDLSENQMIGIDYANTFGGGSDDVCATHDYCDANMYMLPALAKTLSISEDEAGSLINTDGPQADKARISWGQAWDIAKERGFSTLWTHREKLGDDDLKFLVAHLAQLPRQTDKRYPVLVVVDAVDDFEDLTECVAADMENLGDRLPELVADLRATQDSPDDYAVIAVMKEFSPSRLLPPSFW